MKPNKLFLWVITLLLATAGVFVFIKRNASDDSRFISYTADPKKQHVALFWKNDKNEIFRSIQNLKRWLGENNKTLVFAMNAGMYKPDNSPQGLFIEEQKILSPLDTTSGNGNFYLKPNGVFYIMTGNVPVICNTTNFSNAGSIRYATQSGPMLVIDGHLHPAFKEGSSNLNIRNGVGILPGNKILFAMSKKEISFYDFAAYFKKMGCKNALYLDGLVSQTYLPQKQWEQTGGNFGAIIGVVTTSK